MNKDIRRLLRKAAMYGATWERGSNHYKVSCPNGQLIIVSSSPSDHRAVMNARARLRRQGGLPV